MSAGSSGITEKIPPTAPRLNIINTFTNFSDAIIDSLFYKDVIQDD